jgi:hypothetical protein
MKKLICLCLFLVLVLSACSNNNVNESIGAEQLDGTQDVVISNDIGNAGGSGDVVTVEEKRTAPAPNMTPSQQNALHTAKAYLRSSSFSYTGLIDQLASEGFSYDDAKFAVDNCGADWYEQAVKTAKSYLRSSSFSYSELVEQLEYEGFTYDQAVYGAKQSGI